jgi:transposase
LAAVVVSNGFPTSEADVLLFHALALSLLMVEADVAPRKTRSPSPAAVPALLPIAHPHAAGVDVGATALWVAVPPQNAAAPPVRPGLPENVRAFGACTADLRALADWLRQRGVTTVAMEATGVYWIPLYDLLENQGFTVLLVDPRQTQRAGNRPKTDVHDCQWIQRLHSLGLLTAAFRPTEPIRTWRAYQRHRANLVEDAARHLLRVRKALEQMNVKLGAVVSDLTGVTGRGILDAILGGERDPQKLAQWRDRRCKESEEAIAKALEGTWQAEHVFALRQSLALYDFHHQQIAACDREIDAHLQTMALPDVPPLPPSTRPRRGRKDNEPTFAARERLQQLSGVDLTAIEGIDVRTALVVLSEIGTDMSRWPSEKHFGSWLGVAPCPKKSGGRVLSSATRPGVHRAAQAFRLAAKNLHRSQSALGAFLRRIAARRGLLKAITATAYKLARIVYALLKHGQAYVAQGQEASEAAHRERVVRQLKRRAAELNLEVVEKVEAAEPPA